MSTMRLPGKAELERDIAAFELCFDPACPQCGRSNAALAVTRVTLRCWFRYIFKNAVGCHLPKYLVAYACRYNYRHRREQLFGRVLGAMVDKAPFSYHEQVHGERSPLARRRARATTTFGI